MWLEISQKNKQTKTPYGVYMGIQKQSQYLVRKTQAIISMNENFDFDHTMVLGLCLSCTTFRLQLKACVTECSSVQNINN